MAFGFGFGFSRLYGALAAAFSPASLFANGEQGAWYDPSDYGVNGTLFQDSAGTTPVTAVQQPVGLMLDKSKGLVLGPELVINPGPFANTTGWAAFNANSTISAVTGALFSQVSSGAGGAGQTLALTVGKSYSIVATLRNASGDGASINVTNNLGLAFVAQGATITGLTNVTTTLFFTATETNNRLYLRTSAAGASSCYLDNISVKELPGNHAFQTTSASRPVLSARYNLLTATTTLATQSVTTRATTQTLRFTGAGSIVLSGTATGTYTAGTHSIVTTAGTLTLTVSGTVTDADLRVSNDALGQPAYQRVNTSTDYDTVGFKPYLAFDGVDDSLVTNSIDFTGTDKMTVFAGTRVVSGSSSQIFAELSASTDANIGSFATGQGPTSGAAWWGYLIRNGNFYGGEYRGLTSLGNSIVSTLSIDSAVSGYQNSSKLKVNGSLVSVTPFNNSVIGGVFGNYPLYIGRRGGTNFPFNGRLYALIVRGAATNATQLAQTEVWVNGKTGAYIDLPSLDTENGDNFLLEDGSYILLE